MFIWYHGKAMGVLFPHTKKYEHPMCDVKMTSLLSTLPTLPNYNEKQAKNELFEKKNQNIGISPSF